MKKAKDLIDFYIKETERYSYVVPLVMPLQERNFNGHTCMSNVRRILCYMNTIFLICNSKTKMYSNELNSYDFKKNSKLFINNKKLIVYDQNKKRFYDVLSFNVSYKGLVILPKRINDNVILEKYLELCDTLPDVA